jgi:hypothetical protein
MPAPSLPGEAQMPAPSMPACTSSCRGARAAPKFALSEDASDEVIALEAIFGEDALTRHNDADTDGTEGRPATSTTSLSALESVLADMMGPFSSSSSSSSCAAAFSPSPSFSLRIRPEYAPDNDSVTFALADSDAAWNDVRSAAGPVRTLVLHTSSLPPLTLFWAPDAHYPSATPPAFCVSAPWLSLAAARLLEGELLRLWRDEAAGGGGAPVVFSWAEWLRADALAWLLSAQPRRTTGAAEAEEAAASADNDAADVAVLLPSSCLRRLAVPDRPRLHAPPTVPPAPAPAHATTPCLLLGGPRFLPSLCSALAPWAALSSASPNAPSLLVQSLVDALRAADADAEERLWAGSTAHTCAACLTDALPGPACARLRTCGHIFCRACVGAHVRARVDDGAAADIRCLDAGSCDAPLAQVDVREALGGADSAEYGRYEAILLQRALDSMGDVVCCARDGCGKPAIVEEAGVVDTRQWFGARRRRAGGDAAAAAPVFAASSGAAAAAAAAAAVVVQPHFVNLAAEGVSSFSPPSPASPTSVRRRRLARCSYCSHAFCLDCRRNFHGLSPCSDLLDKFRAADEAGRAALALQYGADVVNELLYQLFLDENARACPTCGAAITKNGGCNHMTCRACGCEFCWLCVQRYDGPAHFGRRSAQGVLLCTQFDDSFYWREYGMGADEFDRRFGWGRRG